MSRFERKGGKDPSETSKLQYSIIKSDEEQKRLIESMTRSKKSFEEMEKRNPGRIEKYRESVENWKNEIETLTSELEQELSELLKNAEADINTLSIPEILAKYKSEIDIIEHKDDRRTALLKEKYPNATFSYYSKFFHVMCNKNLDFMFHTPTKAFKGFVSNLKGEKMPFDKLTNDQRIELERFFMQNDKSVFNDETFRRWYLKYFPSFIGELDKVSEVRDCLEMYPEQFSKINVKVSRELQAIGEMPKVVKRVPIVIQYFTYEQREKFAEDYPKILGNALLREPSLLDLLDEKFFNRHNARLVFTDHSKAELNQVFGDKLLRHENLYTHAMFYNYHKPDPILKNMEK